ncbi:TadG family pilus assembly protein [uncultured Sphingomonas sp.]|uniref:TadG family pilus assembly protein n=1 Tax=uncultured Sphingomonas sp. TaxID=158754 RepID=UPI0025E841BA|nr:TadG family pilus assembly protein [uncultured Sphingomonas sp.]
MRTARVLLRCHRGGVAILAALSIAMVVGAATLAVDLGSIFFESRKLQGAADSAALAAAVRLSAPMDAAKVVVAGVRWTGPVTPAVTTGNWTPDPKLPVPARFSPAITSPNAAKVILTEAVPTYFGGVFGIRTVQLSRSAIATRVDMAAFSIGSRLASVNEGVLNQLLGGLTGTTVSLTAGDYGALIGGEVDALAYVAALRTELGLTAASFDQTLATSTTLPHALKALSSVLAARGQAAGAAAVAKIAGAAPSTAMTLVPLMNLGALGKQDEVAGTPAVMVNAYSLLETILQIGGKSNQVALDLGSAAPGLSSVSAILNMGERSAASPWLALTRPGETIVRTAQTRLYVTASLPGSAALAALGVGGVRLPLYVELAEAQAKLTALSCAGGARSVTIQALPSIGHASLAEVPPGALPDMRQPVVESPAMLVDLAVARVQGNARVTLSAADWQTITFNDADLANRATKTVRAAGAVRALASSLVSGANLSVSIGPITLSVSPILAALRPVLTAAAPVLDGVIQPLLDALGIHLGEADVQINGVRCGSAALVA